MARPANREEMAREIAVRLAVRRKFYRGAFVVFTLLVLAVMLPSAWMNPDVSLDLLVAAASAILGTGAVLAWAYVVRKSALYEKAGRDLLDGGR